MKRTIRLAAVAVALCVAGCTGRVNPTRPSEPAPIPPPAPPTASMHSLEAENGTGDGDVRHRSRASGARTVHLGPGERRSWTFTSESVPAQYAVAIRYSNGRYGPSETITLVVDGLRAGSFRSRETGDDSPEGWNTFISDDAGASMLRAGSHTVTLEVAGGDGCVEIDVVTLIPAVGGNW